MRSPEEALINALKNEQARFAVDALRPSSDKTEYDYGFRVGKMAGIDTAIEVILGIIEESKRNFG